MQGATGQSEQVLWEGKPSWKAWPGTTIWGWVLVPVVIGLLFLGTVELRRRSTRWKLTSRRIEIESGLLSHKVETLELWRVQDVRFEQSMLERMLGVGRLLIMANDNQLPVAEVRGVPNGRAVYDALMAAVMASRQQRGVLNLNP